MPGMPWPLPWPFDTTYMQLALIAGLAVGASAPLIGTFLVQKRLSLLGDGIGHVAVAGVGAGLLFGTSPVWTALVVAVVAALALEWLRSRGRTSGDLARGALLLRRDRGGGRARRPLGDQRQPAAVSLRVDPHRDRERRVHRRRTRRS